MPGRLTIAAKSSAGEVVGEARPQRPNAPRTVTVTYADSDDPATADRIVELFRKLLDRERPPPPTAPAPDPTPPASFVYFLQGKTSLLIKIGTSKNPWQRLETLRTGSAEGFHMLGMLAGGHREEREQHRRFAAHRAHGEWFRPAPDLVAFIKSSTRLGWP